MLTKYTRVTELFLAGAIFVGSVIFATLTGIAAITDNLPQSIGHVENLVKFLGSIGAIIGSAIYIKSNWRWTWE